MRLDDITGPLENPLSFSTRNPVSASPPPLTSPLVSGSPSPSLDSTSWIKSPGPRQQEMTAFYCLWTWGQCSLHYLFNYLPELWSRRLEGTETPFSVGPSGRLATWKPKRLYFCLFCSFWKEGAEALGCSVAVTTGIQLSGAQAQGPEHPFLGL